MNESIHSVSSHDCRFLPSRMRGCSLLITLVERLEVARAQVEPFCARGRGVLVDDEGVMSKEPHRMRLGSNLQSCEDTL